MNAKYVKCAAKCCGNTLLDNSNLTFFTFPENKNLGDIWAKNANVSYYYYGSTLCSDHFDDKCFNPKFGKKSVFRQDIEPIPTIFNIKDKKEDPNQPPHITLVDPLKIISKQKPEVSTDTKEYCRMCAIQYTQKNLRPIYYKYSKMVDICLPGKVSQNDELPQNICLVCIQKVTQCSQAIKLFLDSDKKLRSTLLTKTIASTSQDTDIINISDDDDSIADISETGLLDDLMTVLTETNNILDEIANDPLTVSDSEDTNDKTEVQTKYRFECLRCSKLFDYKEQVMLHSYHEHPHCRNDKIISKIVPQKIKVKKVDIPRVKKYHCTSCNIIFDTKELIYYHSTKVHNGNKNLSKIIEIAEVPQKIPVVKYMCLSCPRVYTDPKDIIKHSRMCHKENKIISKSIHCVKQPHEVLPKNTKLPICNSNVPNIDNYPSSDSMGLPIYHRNYTRKPEIVEPLIQFDVKYKCNFCSILANSYNEIFEHFQENHSEEQTESVATVCKFKENPDSNTVIEIKDGTIVDLDPTQKPEKRIYKKLQNVTETAFKCLNCNKIFRTKLILVKHALAKHPNVDGLTEINCKSVTIQRKHKTYIKGKDRLECLHCCSLHTSEYSLLKHTEQLHPDIGNNKFLYRFLDHQKKGPIECLHCSFISKTFSHYCNHTRCHLSFNCKEKDCGKKFTKVSALRQHEKEHIPTTETSWNCFVCSEEFNSRLLLYKHESTHKIPEDVQCPKCNKKFETRYDLKKHEKIHETCLCDICGKTYELPYIRNHLQTHNKDTPYKCKICGKGFKTSSILSKHHRKHNLKSEKTVCQICGKVICRASIPLHMKIHSSQKNEVCDICGASFHRKDHLRLHRARHATEQTTYPCPQSECNTILYTRKAYAKHMSTVHNVPESSISEKKIFQCTICQKQFSQKCYLTDHYLWHKGEKIYGCETCGKKFGTKIAVYQHRLIHLPYEQFKYHCSVCNKRFKRAEQFRNHRRIHTGEKPFPCPICQRPFRVRGEMVKHMRIHVPRENRDIKIKAKPKTITPENISQTNKIIQSTILNLNQSNVTSQSNVLTRSKLTTSPKVIISSPKQIQITKPQVLQTYVRKLQNIVKPINIKTDNIFQTAKKVKLTSVKNDQNQTIFYIDDNISSDSNIEIGDDMPELE